MFNVIEPKPPTEKQLARLCRACNRGGLSSQEAQDRVHEYCRSKLGPNWRLPQVYR